ncbi:hypothetical protein D3C76_1176310 [compost metagenome]
MVLLSSKSNPLFSPFVILLSVIVLGGVSQGLLLPLLSIFMEERGIPSSVNGNPATIKTPFLPKRTLSNTQYSFKCYCFVPFQSWQHYRS